MWCVTSFRIWGFHEHNTRFGAVFSDCFYESTLFSLFTRLVSGLVSGPGWVELPAPLTWLQRLIILRDAARALVHLHAQQPVLLHGDVATPST